MSYQALYRKYRPKSFADVVGQDHVTQTLKNALREGHVAHAYLFSGPRGTGKTTIARILAAAVNCIDLKDGEPCGKCESCASISGGSWGLIEIDGASNNSVEDIRELQARIHTVPINAQRQVYIIDEVHQLSAAAFNAFLKTLEEPPPHAMFILATTEPGKLLPTVLSRCQHYPFRRISPGIIADELKKILDLEKVPYEDEAIALIARLADGALRDAKSITDQLIAFDRKKLSLENCRKVLGTVDEDLLISLASAVLKGDSAGILKAAEEFTTAGREFGLVMKDLTGLFRDALVGSLDVSALKAEGRSDDYCSRLAELASGLGIDALSKIIATLARRSSDMRYEQEKRILFETALLELSQRLIIARRKKQAGDNPSSPTKPKASAVVAAPVLEEQSAKPAPATEVVKAPEEPPAVELNDPVMQWDQLISMLSRASVAKAVLMSRGKPTTFSDDILHVEFAREETIFCAGLNTGSVKGELERILSDLMDKNVLVELEMTRAEEKGNQAGLFEGNVTPDVSELKGVIEEHILNRVPSARIRRIGKSGQG